MSKIINLEKHIELREIQKTLKEKDNLDKRLFDDFVDIYSYLFNMEELKMLFQRLKIEFCKNKENTSLEDIILAYGDLVVENYIKEIKHKIIKKEIRELLQEHRQHIPIPVENYFKWFFAKDFNLNSYWELFWDEWEIRWYFSLTDLEPEDIHAPVLKYNEEFIENFLTNSVYESYKVLIKNWIVSKEQKDFRKFTRKKSFKAEIIKINPL